MRKEAIKKKSTCPLPALHHCLRISCCCAVSGLLPGLSQPDYSAHKAVPPLSLLLLPSIQTALPAREPWVRSFICHPILACPGPKAPGSGGQGHRGLWEGLQGSHLSCLKAQQRFLQWERPSGAC